MNSTLIQNDSQMVRMLPLLLVTLTVLGLLIRLFFYNWHPGPYTDGLIISFFEPLGGGKRMPLYPALVRGLGVMFNDRLFAGFLISALAGAALPIPVAGLARLIHGPRAAIFAAILIFTSALPFRWSLRVMTDSLFTIIFCTSILAIIQAFEKPTANRLAGACTLVCLSFLTRPEGILLVPPLIILLAYIIKRIRWVKLLPIWWSVIPWAGLLYWLLVRPTPGYKVNILSIFTKISFSRFFEIVGNYFIVSLHVLTLPIVLLLVYGLYCSFRDWRAKPSTTKIWLVFLIYVLGGNALVLFIHPYYSSRHLIHLVPLVIVAAASGCAWLFEVRSRKIAVAFAAAACIWSVILTGLTLNYSRDAWGSFYRTADFIAKNKPGERIFASRLTKLGYRTETPIQKAPFNAPWRFKHGDLLVIDSFYENVATNLSILRQHWKVELVHIEKSSLISVLGDEMGENLGSNATTPSAMCQYLTKRHYWTLLVRLNSYDQELIDTDN